MFGGEGEIYELNFEPYGSRMQAHLYSVRPRNPIRFSCAIFHLLTRLRMLSLKQTNSAKKKSHPIGWDFFLAEKERFELSRR